jgi:photosystem II stability/assembly factor-like uncharacterized protein
MFVGTEAGVSVLLENDGRWDEERTTLTGKDIEAIAASHEAGVVYAAVRHDGVYASSDGGRSWDHVFGGDVRSLAVDPSNPTSVYAGTEPVHLYRSLDIGDSWAEIEGLQRLPESVRDKWWFPVYPHEPHVLSIYVDAHERRRIYVGLEHGGILRTDDGGESWEDISAGIEYLDIHMVAGDPAQESLVYAATARGFYRSEDYGRGWVLSHNGLSRDYMHDFVVRPGTSSALFMTTANGTPPAWMRATKAESAIFRSKGSGLSWQKLGGGLPSAMERMIWNVVGDPTDDARLYAGAGDYAATLPRDASPGGEVWATEDRGDSWHRVYEASSPVRKLCVTAV